jgi:hypothetical protein
MSIGFRPGLTSIAAAQAQLQAQAVQTASWGTSTQQATSQAVTTPPELRMVRCSTCRAFHKDDRQSPPPYGTCRAKPPTIVAPASRTEYTAWPTVNGDRDWCMLWPHAPDEPAHPAVAVDPAP